MSNVEKIEAKMANGVLEVIIAKAKPPPYYSIQ